MRILITGGLGHIGSFVLQNINKFKTVKKVYVIENITSEILRKCDIACDRFVADAHLLYFNALPR